MKFIDAEAEDKKKVSVHWHGMVCLLSMVWYSMYGMVWWDVLCCVMVWSDVVFCAVCFGVV